LFHDDGADEEYQGDFADVPGHVPLLWGSKRRIEQFVWESNRKKEAGKERARGTFKYILLRSENGIRKTAKGEKCKV
jgi:hypothetical protein